MERRTLKVGARAIPVRFSTDTLESQGEILSLSMKGLFVRASELPPVGATVRLVLEARGHGKMEIVGEVRSTTDEHQAGHDGDSGFGLRLTGWNEAYSDFFERMLFVQPPSDPEETTPPVPVPAGEEEPSTDPTPDSLPEIDAVEVEDIDDCDSPLEFAVDCEEVETVDPSESPHAEDRRGAPRFDAPSPVYFVGGRQEGVGTLADLSLTGARIENASPRLRTGVAATLLLELKQDSYSVELKGRVVRETETGFAVEFTFDPESSSGQFLRWILRRPARLRST